MSKIQLKLCGVTRVEDAELAVDLGVDFLGLNFWPGSRRYLEAESAARIARAVEGRIEVVGVWVDPDPEEVTRISAELRLDYLQFHGDETPESLEAFTARVIKAFRVDEDFEADRLSPFRNVWGYLFDCAQPGRYGGTGVSWPYERIASLKPDRPSFIAGGLNPDNVGEAIVRSGVSMVDVCSGVESEPGVKAPELVRRFVEEVRNVSQAT